MYRLLALALLWPSLALAEPKDDARRHFMEGLEAARMGDYQAALSDFLAAQAAWPHPATLFNIARSYADLGDLPAAIAAYREFQRMAPDRAPEVEAAIAELQARLTPAPPPLPSQVQPSVRSDEVERLVAIAAELQALTEALATRPAAPTAPAGASGETGADTGEEVVPPAEEPPPREDELIGEAYQREVVSASRFGQSPLDSPSAVTVLTRNDIRLSGATGIPDLLRRVVGVEVMAITPSKPDVSIRGFNDKLANKVLVLVDGRSVYMDMLGTTMWDMLPVSIEEIDRIEVIRGPGSAVYGANAMTGVIHIITRTPEGVGSTVRIDGGSPGYLRASGIAQGQENATSYRLGAQLLQRGQWADLSDGTDHSAVIPLAPVGAQDLATDTVTLTGRLDRQIAPRAFLSLSGGYSEGLTEFHSLGVLGDYFFDFQHFYLRTDVSRGPVHLRAFWNRDRGTTGPWLQRMGASREMLTFVDNDIADLELEGSKVLHTGAVTHRLQGGAGLRFKDVGFGYLKGDGYIQELHQSLFFSEEASLERLKLVGTVRADHHPLLDLQQTLSPRGALIFRVADRTALRAGVGSSFREMNFIESYLDMTLPTGVEGTFVQDRGDLSLAPERVLTAEVGLHDESTLYHTADVSLYVNRVQDLIGLEPVTPELHLLDAERSGYLVGTTGFSNHPEVYTGAGLEAEARLFPLDGLDLYGNVALESISVSDGVDRWRDRSTSQVKVNGGAMYRAPRYLVASVDASFVSAQTWELRDFDEAGQLVVVAHELPARTLLSARVGVQPFQDEELELSLSGWNLLQLLGAEPIREHPTAPPLQPIVYGSLSYGF
ncbi:MAG: TonB-dependent receptor [Deltaproteobacteria bacterium]|nr:TonB-dependent receptor [Deltaproteobacteria bacterium]